MKRLIFLITLFISIILFSKSLFASSVFESDEAKAIDRQTDVIKAQRKATEDLIDEEQFSQMTEGEAVSDEIQGLREDLRQTREEEQEEKKLEEQDALDAKREQLQEAYLNGDRGDEAFAERERSQIDMAERTNKATKEKLPSIKAKYNLPAGSESDVVAGFINAESYFLGMESVKTNTQLETRIKKIIDEYEHPEKISDTDLKYRWFYRESEVLRNLLESGEISNDEYRIRAKKLSEKWGLSVISMDSLFNTIMEMGGSNTKSKNNTIDDALSFYASGDISLNEYMEMKNRIIEAYRQKQMPTEVNSKDSGDLTDKLKTLNKLLADSLITKDDFAQQKKKLLDNYMGKKIKNH